MPLFNLNYLLISPMSKYWRVRSSHPETLVCTLTMASEGWVTRLRLQRSDSREKAGVDYLEDSLRGLVQHV